MKFFLLGFIPLIFIFSFIFIDFSFEIEKPLSVEKETFETVSLGFVGDIMLSRSVAKSIERYEDFTFPFGVSSDFFSSFDIVSGNLEGPISLGGRDMGSVYSFRAHPSVIQGLLGSNFSVLSLANNHIYDWGSEALMDTKNLLSQHAIASVGAGVDILEASTPTIIEKNNISVGFIGCSTIYGSFALAGENKEGLLSCGSEYFFETLSNLKDNVDVSVVSLHWGDEYSNVSPSQRTFAYELIGEYGVNIIVGHHPHVVQSIEWYENSLIFYSLGNFIFDQYFSDETMRGMVGEVWVSKRGIESLFVYESILSNQYSVESINPHPFGIEY